MTHFLKNKHGNEVRSLSYHHFFWRHERRIYFEFEDL